MPFDIVGFSHIGLAVTDIEEFRTIWGTALGITDWSVTQEGAPGGFQLHGKIIEGQTTARTAFAKVGGTCIELVQPVENKIAHSEHIDAVGSGMHHIAFWVNDLPKQIESAGDMGWEVVYSPISLRKGLGGKVASATTSGWDTALEYPPFFSFVDPESSKTRCTLELIDAQYASDYREAYGDYTYYPGDLPY